MHHTALLHLMYCLKHMENMYYSARKATQLIGKLPLIHHSQTGGQLCHIPYQMEQKVEQEVTIVYSSFHVSYIHIAF